MKSEVYLIVPARNVESTLEKSVLTAHAQLRTNYQLLIVENGSVDNTLAVAERIKHEHTQIPIHILTSPPGKIKAFMTGLEYVKVGIPIFFMDADVKATETSFKPLYEQLIKHPSLIVVGGYPVTPLEYTLAEPTSYLNLSSFFPLSKIVNDDSYGFHMASLDPQPSIPSSREKRLKPFFHGRIFALRDKRFIPNIIPRNNVADDVFWSRHILLNYGRGSIRTRYDARVLYIPKTTEEELMLYRERIQQQVNDVTEEFLQFKPLERAFKTLRDWSYINELPQFVIDLFKKEHDIYSRTNLSTKRIAWHGDL